ncbi:MAG TPA: acyl-CoA reductase, partial [Bacteroidales bacterium]|nr:acyl-CoA reductase [Bacteroidales bacterium]
MIHNEQIIKLLSTLGMEFGDAGQVLKENRIGEGNDGSSLVNAAFRAYYENPWFIPEFVGISFISWSKAMTEEKISGWISRYKTGKEKPAKIKRVGIIMAGNIPMVGLHDLICVLASGNQAVIKASSTDQVLIRAVADYLISQEKGIADQIFFTDEPLRDIDAIIATGSNNSFRYFDYYFSKYQHIIRKNRNSIAVITDQDSPEDFEALGDDIFTYFGLGCRNVSKVYHPEKFDINLLINSFNKFSFIKDHHKYRNNYDYQKSVFLVNGISHLDNGFVLARESTSLISPVSVIHTEPYRSVDSLDLILREQQDSLQCVVAG